MIKLTQDVTNINLHFNFRNPQYIPKSLLQRVRTRGVRQGKVHDKEKLKARKKIKHETQVSIKPLVRQLTESGWTLVDANYTRHESDVNTLDVQQNHHLNYKFARTENVVEDVEFEKQKMQILHDLTNLCINALWQVEAVENPLLENDVEHDTKKYIILMFSRRVGCYIGANGRRYLAGKRNNTTKSGTPAKLANSKKHLIVDSEIRINKLQ